MSGGKVILVRQRDFEKMGDAVLLRVFIWCLSKMARRKSQQRIRTGRGAWTKVEVQVGQFAYQRQLAEDALQIPGPTIRDKMILLAGPECNRIIYAASPDKQWTLVTILNHERYLPGAPASPTRMRGTAEGFDEFWAAWPKHERKVAKGKCLQVWRRKGLAKQCRAVMAVLDSTKRSHDWKKNGGEYIPAPLVWLNGDRWQAEVEDLAPAGAEPEDRMKIQMAFDALPEAERERWRGDGGDWTRAAFEWWRDRKNHGETAS